MFSLILLLPVFAALAQNQEAAPVVSPEVQGDNRVTVRLRAPNAQQVSFELEGSHPVAMTKDQEGVWSLTTAALEPDFYSYMFIVDGVRMLDPSNQLMQPN